MIRFLWMLFLTIVIYDFRLAIAQPNQAYPNNGILILAGGGEINSDIPKAMLEYSGKDNPNLVIIPTADGNFWKDDYRFEHDDTITRWHARGFKELEILHTTDSSKIDEDFVKPIDNADCVWITGGKQSRLRDVYKGTKVESALIKLLNRGGVVGGTSAGSSACSEIMIVGGKDVAEISEGFSILKDIIFDTHYFERSRKGRLQKAVIETKAKFGMGISEKCAVVIDLKKEIKRENLLLIGDPDRFDLIVNVGE